MSLPLSSQALSPSVMDVDDEDSGALDIHSSLFLPSNSPHILEHVSDATNYTNAFASVPVASTSTSNAPWMSNSITHRPRLPAPSLRPLHLPTSVWPLCKLCFFPCLKMMMMNRYTNPIRAGIVRVNNQCYHRSSFSVGTADGPLASHTLRLGLYVPPRMSEDLHTASPSIMQPNISAELHAVGLPSGDHNAQLIEVSGESSSSWWTTPNRTHALQHTVDDEAALSSGSTVHFYSDRTHGSWSNPGASSSGSTVHTAESIHRSDVPRTADALTIPTANALTIPFADLDQWYLTKNDTKIIALAHAIDLQHCRRHDTQRERLKIHACSPACPGWNVKLLFRRLARMRTQPSITSVALRDAVPPLNVIYSHEYSAPKTGAVSMLSLNRYFQFVRALRLICQSLMEQPTFPKSASKFPLMINDWVLVEATLHRSDSPTQTGPRRYEFQARHLRLLNLPGPSSADACPPDSQVVPAERADPLPIVRTGNHRQNHTNRMSTGGKPPRKPGH
ncbi:hypothetical protein B0H13DRAFT_1910774 [Mycena leptocephala]|nr:hypothetical protein B0H13DRAFT_1910774 [Mycena leptocephala]